MLFYFGVIKMNTFEVRKDGLYINGAKVSAFNNLKIESYADDLTKLSITLYGELKGIDDQNSYSFV